MCRFVAVISKNNTDFKKYFKFLLMQAKNGKRSPHPDGFGYWIKSENGEYLYKSTSPIWDNEIKLPLGIIGFFHARKRGEAGAEVNLVNVHPFVRDGAVFMHNGLLDIPRNPAAIGNTDTESFFIELLDKGPIDGVKDMIEKYDFKSLNFVMYYRDVLYVFRGAKTLQGYFTIFIKMEEDKIVISTEKDDDSWIEVRNGEMWLIDQGLHSEKFCISQDMCR